MRHFFLGVIIFFPAWFIVVILFLAEANDLNIIGKLLGIYALGALMAAISIVIGGLWERRRQ